MPISVTPSRTALRPLTALRSGVALGLIGLLAACAGTPDLPSGATSMPVIQEAAKYRARAKSYYAPPGPPSDPWGPYINEASNRFDVPGEWIRAVMKQESGGHLFDRNGNFITSVPGAMGLLQLMPPAYDDMRQQYGLGDDPYDPHDNIMAGTAYIRQMYDIYGSPGFLAAYNDGPGNLDSYLRRGRPLPRETRRYVAAIGRQIVGITPQNRSAADLLVTQHDPKAQIEIAENEAPPSTASQSVSSAWSQKPSSSEAPTNDDTTQDTTPDTTPEASSPVTPTPDTATGTPDSVSAAWAARGITSAPPVQPVTYHTHSSPPPETDVADNQVTAQEIPIGHHLQPQPIVAVLPSGNAAHYRLAPPAIPLVRHAPPPSTEPRNWAIQVGAFGNANQASTAAVHAQNQGGSTLTGARTQVASTTKGRTRLYRARLTNLTHENALEACHHMPHNTPCAVVPPGTF